MEARSWFRLNTAPAEAQLEALFEFAATRRAHYPSFLLVERHAAGSDAAGPRGPSRSAEWRELFAALEPYQMTAAEIDRWPGAGPHQEQSRATVSFFHLEPGSARALARAGSGFADGPRFPGSLTILANDKTPWLVAESKAHFLLHLSEGETRELQKALPWLSLSPASEIHSPHSGK